jgi:hypothetical protein
VPVSALATVAVVIIGAVRLIKPVRDAFTSQGDAAFVELDVLHALHGGVALGVYSRFGWHHPGPALFYLLAPVYWLSDEHSRSLFLGAWLVNGASAVVAVLVVRARAGELAARITAVFVLAFLAALGFRELIDPWNPKLVALPLLLLMVSVAACVDGSRWSFVLVIVVASYLVQADIGTAPLGVALVAFAAVGYVHAARHPRATDDARPPMTRSRLWPWVPAAVAAGAGLLMWSGPLVQQLTSNDGNLSKILRFSLHPRGPNAVPRAHGFNTAIAAVVDRATVVPFGNAGSLNGHLSRYLLGGVCAGVGLVVASALRRRARFLAAFALLTPIGLAVAVVAVMRTPGPLVAYLVAWTQTLMLPVFVVATWFVVDGARARLDARSPRSAGRSSRLLASASAVVVVVAALVAGRVALHGPLASFGDSPDARTVATRMEHVVRERTPFTVRFVQLSGPREALIVQLEKDGARFRLDPPIHLDRGNARSAREAPVFVVRPSTPPSTPAVPGAKRLLTVGRYDVWFSPGG